MRQVLFIIIAAILQSACISQKAYMSATPSSHILDIHPFEPLAYIAFVDKGNQMAPSDSLSREFSNLWIQHVGKGSSIPFEKEILLPEFVENEAITFEIEHLFTLAEEARGKNLHAFDLPPNLVAVIDLYDQRFYLLTLSTGFTRRIGNYGGQIAKGVGIGILTLGMFAPIPVKANSGVRVMILDNQLGEIAYYKSSFNPEGEPLEEKTLSKHLKYLFKGYLW